MNKLSSVLLISLLGLSVSCGKNGAVDCFNGCLYGERDKPAPVVTPPPLSILNNFQATSQIVVIEKLNLAALSLGVEESSDAIFPCTLGQVTNNTPVPGNVGEGNVLITGTLQSGTIQFGNLKNGGRNGSIDPAADPECRSVSRETYEYNIVGDELTLCMVNYPYCTTYIKQ